MGLNNNMLIAGFEKIALICNQVPAVRLKKKRKKKPKLNREVQSSESLHGLDLIDEASDMPQSWCSAVFAFGS